MLLLLLVLLLHRWRMQLLHRFLYRVPDVCNLIDCGAELDLPERQRVCLRQLIELRD